MVTARSLPEIPFFGGQSNHSVALACALAFFAVRLLADFFFGSGAEDEPKNRLTHGKESQCAKRLNDGLPEGGGLLHTESNWKMITDSYRLAILSSRCKLFKRLDNSYGFCIKRRIQGTFN